MSDVIRENVASVANASRDGAIQTPRDNCAFAPANLRLHTVASPRDHLELISNNTRFPGIAATREQIVVAGASDTAAPVVSNYLPLRATSINPTTAITFDVVDNSGAFTRVLVTATQTDLDTATVISDELVYNGSTFATRYAGSSITAIAGGYHFVVRRTGGWVGNLTINTYAIDRAGNEGT